MECIIWDDSNKNDEYENMGFIDGVFAPCEFLKNDFLTAANNLKSKKFTSGFYMGLGVDIVACLAVASGIYFGIYKCAKKFYGKKAHKK